MWRVPLATHIWKKRVVVHHTGITNYNFGEEAKTRYIYSTMGPTAKLQAHVMMCCRTTKDRNNNRHTADNEDTLS